MNTCSKCGEIIRDQINHTGLFCNSRNGRIERVEYDNSADCFKPWQNEKSDAQYKRASDPARF